MSCKTLVLRTALVLPAIVLVAFSARATVNYDDPKMAEDEEASYSFPGFKEVDNDGSFDPEEIQDARNIVSAVEDHGVRLPASDDAGD